MSCLCERPWRIISGVFLHALSTGVFLLSRIFTCGIIQYIYENQMPVFAELLHDSDDKVRMYLRKNK